MSEAPLGPWKRWPFRFKHQIESKSISTCIPALAATARGQLQPLLKASKAQTLIANETVIVVSNVSPEVISKGNGTVWCEQLWNSLGQDDNTKVICIGERLTAGRARNIAAYFAVGEIISFIDADDNEVQTRNEIIRKAFDCSKGALKLLLHSFSRKPEQLFPDYSFRRLDCEKWGRTLHRGDYLYEKLKSTHDRWWLLPDIANGHLITHRSLFENIQFSTLAKGEDSLFIRDVLYMYGRENNTVTFIHIPLTSYFKSSGANKDLL